jgi:hypothetical protein
MARNLTVPTKQKKKKLSTLQKAALVAALPLLPVALPIIESGFHPVKAGKAAAEILSNPFNPKAWEDLAKYKAGAVKEDVKIAKRLAGRF